ncbi:helix-turn-helix domain-containing protein [Lachnospiraceae bacterium NSJ-143]|nr:helix-turn-helix domain-containing protein [Lachnospiraceae bacterium NSJ-143]
MSFYFFDFSVFFIHFITFFLHFIHFPALLNKSFTISVSKNKWGDTIIGERLQDLRIEAGVKQEDLGKMLNLSKNAVSAYEKERNEPSDEIKIKLARFFDVSVDYLLGLTDDPCPYNSRKRHVRIPDNMTDEQIAFIEKFIKFLAENS